MANFPPAFLNGGKVESLRPSDGGLEIEVIDCPAVTSPVVLFPTVDNTGSVTMFANFDGAANVGKVGGAFTFLGTVGINENFVVQGGAIFNGSVDLGNAPGDAILFVGEVVSDIIFENSAARTIGIDSQQLTLETTTAGTLFINGATEVEVNTLQFDVNAANDFSLRGTLASEVVTTGAGADLTLGARGATVPLNEATATTLSGLFAAGSLIGCLNELKNSSGATTVLSYLASEGVAPGDVVCLEWDAGNLRIGVYLADNTVTWRQRPVGVALNGGGVGAVIRIATVGEVVVNTNLSVPGNTEGEYVYLSTTGTLTQTAPVVPPATPGDTSQTIGVITNAAVAGTATVMLQINEPHVL